MASAYQQQDRQFGLDYNLVQPGFLFPDGSPFFYRGPAVPDDGNYFTCLGAAQTFGRYAEQPYPALLEQALGTAVVNLGMGGAGPAVYTSIPAVLDIVNKSSAAIIQIMSGRSASCSMFVSLKGTGTGVRQSDGEVMQAVDFVRSILHSKALVKRYLEETLFDALASMLRLLDSIQVPKILFWFSTIDLRSKRPPDIERETLRLHPIFNGFPQMIAADFVEKLKPKVDAFVECASCEGLPERLFAADGSFVENNYYPSKEMHRAACDALLPACRELL